MRLRFPPTVLAAWLALSIAAPTTVHAGPAPLLAALTAKQRKAKAKAQKLVSQGFVAAKKGIFTEALESFEAAYELYPSPKILLNIGTSLRHLGHNADAARIYERYLEDPEASPERAKEVRRLIVTIDELVGLLELTIKAPDDEYEARLDGKLIEPDRLTRPLRVDPGEHSVAVTIGEHPSEARNVTVEAGSHIELAFEPPKPRPASTGENDMAVQRGVGYALGGAGILGVLIGTIAGAVALSTDGAADDECNTANGQPKLCDADAVELSGDASGQATLSTVSFVLGGLFLGAGAITLVMAEQTDADVEQDEDTEVSVVILPGGGIGLGVKRNF